MYYFYNLKRPILSDEGLVKQFVLTKIYSWLFVLCCLLCIGGLTCGLVYDALVLHPSHEEYCMFFIVIGVILLSLVWGIMWSCFKAYILRPMVYKKYASFEDYSISVEVKPDKLRITNLDNNRVISISRKSLALNRRFEGKYMTKQLGDSSSAFLCIGEGRMLGDKPVVADIVLIPYADCGHFIDTLKSAYPNFKKI